jgi:hypothetical protein
MSEENEVVERDEKLDKVALAVRKLMVDAGLSPREIIELHMMGMWGMAIFDTKDLHIARSKLTAYFTQLSDELVKTLDEEEFNAKLKQASKTSA